MSKLLWNEAERFLIENWEESRFLEKTMEGIRTKYKQVFQRIVDAVIEVHPEFDAKGAFPTQSWSMGSIGFGRKSWPGGEEKSPSGLWVEHLSLEILTAKHTDPPFGLIWVPKKINLDRDAARLMVSAAAKDILTEEELAGTSEESGEELFSLPAPSKSDLLRELSDGEGQGFVKLLVSQFDMMARFVPVLDKVFRECMRKS